MTEVAIQANVRGQLLDYGLPVKETQRLFSLLEDELASACFARAPAGSFAVANTCAACGETLKPGAKFCAGCGAPAAQAAPPVPACASCGVPTKPGAKFCATCGAPATQVAPSIPQCAQCGAPTKSGAKFCADCGAPVAQAAPPLPVCARCGAPTKPGAKFCAACGHSL